LKKQSQFAGGQISVNSYMKEDYEIFSGLTTPKNKANQTQFRLAPRPALGD
jgi:hypothetical protein